MPTVPVKADRHPEELLELLDLGDALGRRPAGLGPGREFPHPKGRVGTALGPEPRIPTGTAADPITIDHGGVEPVAVQKLPNGLAAQVKAVAAHAHVGRRMLEGQCQGALAGRLSTTMSLVLAQGIVHGHIKARLAIVVVGGQQLHARPAAWIGAAVLQRPLPRVLLHLARTAGQKHLGLRPEVGHGQLREADLPNAPFGGTPSVRNVQWNAPAASGMTLATTRSPRSRRSAGRCQRISAPLLGIGNERSRSHSSRHQRFRRSISLVVTCRSVRSNSGKTRGASSWWCDATSYRLARRMPPASCWRISPRFPAVNTVHPLGCLPDPSARPPRTAPGLGVAQPLPFATSAIRRSRGDRRSKFRTAFSSCSWTATVVTITCADVGRQAAAVRMAATG